ncbi:MAG: M60 family metallopeptidase, partial [Fuerstiella sp.]
AIEAPTFVLGQMTDLQWQTERLKPGAYAELISERLAISVPSSWIRDLDNPTDLMNFWNDAVERMDWVGAVESIRTGPERFNVDVQISVGLLHAGNPIQGPIWASEEIVDLAHLQANGNWGYFHELGHEKQRNNTLGHGYNSAWTFDGDTEVTVNIFANSALELHVPNSPTGGWGYSVYPDLVLERAAATVNDASKPNFEQKDPYPFYFQLADGPWGWQGYRDVMATYVDDYLNTPAELPSGNADEKDQWLIRWSQVNGYDMTRYMVTNWGLEVSPSAIAQVAALNLPEWMPLIGQDDMVAYHVGESITFNVLDNDLTLDGVAAVDSFTAVSAGTLVDNGNGSFTFTPAVDQVGDATFTYVVSNVSGQTNSQTVTIAEPQPFAWWKFDDGAGSIAIDSSGNNSDGTVDGAAWAGGVMAGGLQFDGVDDRITFGTGPSLSGKTDFTLSARVRTTTTSTGVIIQQRNGGFNGEYQFKVNSNGTLGFFLYGNSAYQYDFASTQTINDGEWHHVAAVRLGTEGLLYIDGVQAASASGTARDLAASIGVGIGADIRGDNNHFNGSMDDVRIYGSALTATEIAILAVGAVNDDPTLDALSNVSIAEDASEQTVNLTGITAGGGETQPLRVTASSSSMGLIPNPTVTYTSPNETGSIAFTPVADQSGTATITVTVEDGGLDGNLSTVGDNATFSRTFDVTVNAVNDDPTLDAIGNLTINEDASEQTVNLSGITAGGGESQPLRVTASSSIGLIPNPAVTYTSANATGSLKFTPVTDQSGTATITVTVEDGGPDGNLSTAGDNATFSRTFDVTVNA